MENRKELIDNILEELNSRGGFDDWWCNIDEDIQEEIIENLVNILPIQDSMRSENKLICECDAKVAIDYMMLGYDKCPECLRYF